jgi:hypothetical protein
MHLAAVHEMYWTKGISSRMSHQKLEAEIIDPYLYTKAKISRSILITYDITKSHCFYMNLSQCKFIYLIFYSSLGNYFNILILRIKDTLPYQLLQWHVCHDTHPHISGTSFIKNTWYTLFVSQYL